LVNQVQQDREVIAQEVVKYQDHGNQTQSQKILFKDVGGVVDMYQVS
jgi:hypothetical protein